jgi:outer membrane biosynthesis protein TonB
MPVELRKKRGKLPLVIGALALAGAAVAAVAFVITRHDDPATRQPATHVDQAAGSGETKPLVLDEAGAKPEAPRAVPEIDAPAPKVDATGTVGEPKADENVSVPKSDDTKPVVDAEKPRNPKHGKPSGKLPKVTKVTKPGKDPKDPKDPKEPVKEAPKPEAPVVKDVTEKPTATKVDPFATSRPPTPGQPAPTPK